MELIKIVLLAVVAACLYGIVQDQVTARVCIEYFTVGHPHLLDTTSPTLIALGWGVVATWWYGLLLGIPLGLSCRLGKAPRLGAAQMIRPIAWLMTVTGATALVAGVIGYFCARAGIVWLLDPLCFRVAADRHALFLADLWAHLAAYGVGGIGAVAMCVWAVRHRRKSGSAGKAKEDSAPET
jgi:hypothetical protein